MKRSSDFSADWLDLPSFAKIMIGDFHGRFIRVDCHNGKIPLAFLKHIPGEYPRVFRLSRLNNGHWDVRACKENELKEADFLVFHYGGDAGFRVTIFGRHCCIRSGVVMGNDGEETRPDKEREKIVDIDSDESSGDEESDSEYDSSDDDYERPSSIRRKKGNGTEARLKKEAPHVSLPNRISQKTNFRIVMRKTYIRKRYLSVPVAMSAHLLGSEEEYIKLVARNKIWEVKLNVYEESYKLGAGWPAFVKENYLKEGDVCNFEVTKHSGEVCLLATIRKDSYQYY